MKHVLIFSLLFCMLPYAAKAQWGNTHDYNSCPKIVTCFMCSGCGYNGSRVCYVCKGQGRTQCQICSAADAGRNAFDKAWAEHETRVWNSPLECLSEGLDALVTGHLSKAFKYVSRSRDIGELVANYYLGQFYELGIGVTANQEMAKTYYTYGANRGNQPCARELERVRKKGFLAATETNRANYVLMHQQYWIMVHQGTSNSYSSSSSSSSNRNYSSSSVCYNCGGTGIDPLAQSGSWSGAYNWCGYSNGSGQQCAICGSYSQHCHSRCSHCNVPR